MEERDILDYFGVVLGKLEMPIGTSEEEWSQALAPYAYPPPSMIQEVMIKRGINRGYTQSIIDAVLVDMLNKGANTTDTSYMYNNCSEILCAMRDGMFRTAELMLQSKTPSGAFDAEVISSWRERLRAHF